MGRLDVLAKEIFEEETRVVTQGAVVWLAPQEIRLGEVVYPDGFLSVRHPERLQSLPPPWNLLSGQEVLLEIKMQGDHMGLLEWLRAILRRAARDVEQCRQRHSAWPGHEPLWFVAPVVPGWLKERYVLSLEGPGCYRIQAWPHQILWLAANELPLHAALLPFLVARSGKALYEFMQWTATQKPLEWVMNMAKNYQFSDKGLQRLMRSAIPEDEEDARHSEMMARTVLEYLAPQLLEQHAQEGRAKGKAEGKAEELLHLFARRVGRPLQVEERESLVKMMTLGAGEALEEALFAHQGEALAQWLLRRAQEVTGSGEEGG